MPSPLSLYFHIPFCLHKCSYCDFYSIPTGTAAIPAERYVECLRSELRVMTERHALHERPLHSIFFGGGTPSMLAPALFGDLLAACARVFAVPADVEMTCEANPETLTLPRLSGLRAAGINRLSMGVQSFHPQHLQFLERVHSAERAIAAARDIRRAGFANVNLDLMYGLPGQTMKECCADIAQAVALEPTHISAYQLTVEDRTPLAAQVRAGRVHMPADELVLAMWDAVRERLAAAGYAAYEISNHAQPGAECRHNLHYWAYGEYLGLGAGACSFVRMDGQGRDRRAGDDDRRVTPVGGPRSRQQPAVRRSDAGEGGDRLQDPPNSASADRALYGMRFQRARNLRRYLAGELGCDDEDPITREMAMGECAWLALRLERGLAEAHFRRHFDISPSAIYGQQFAEWIAGGWLHEHPAPDRRWVVTPPGRRLLDTMCAALVSDGHIVNVSY